MKLGILTTSVRPNPRLLEMARSLIASLTRAPSHVHLAWAVLVPPGALTEELETFLRHEDEKHDRLEIAVGRSADLDALKPAVARNTMLRVLDEDYHPDYVVFLDDCTVVTSQFVRTAAEIAHLGKGWRCKSAVLPDIVVPPDGALRYRDHHDRLRPVPHTTVGTPCWGAPMDTLRGVGGFDTTYDGELKHNDLELITRLSRVGLSFVTTERAIAVRLRRTLTDIAGRDAYVGHRNLALYNELVADKTRIYPLTHSEIAIEDQTDDQPDETPAPEDLPPPDRAPDLADPVGAGASADPSAAGAPAPGGDGGRDVDAVAAAAPAQVIADNAPGAVIHLTRAGQLAEPGDLALLDSTEPEGDDEEDDGMDGDGELDDDLLELLTAPDASASPTPATPAPDGKIDGKNGRTHRGVRVIAPLVIATLVVWGVLAIVLTATEKSADRPAIGCCPECGCGGCPANGPCDRCLRGREPLARPRLERTPPPSGAPFR